MSIIHHRTSFSFLDCSIRRVVTSLLFFLSLTAQAALTAYDLRCEMLHQPWGIDTTTPALSWKLTLDHNNVRQSAYQILAASRPDLLTEEKADLWNTGKVESDQSLWIPYAGRQLQSRSVVYWQVKVWDENGKSGDWARGAKFSVGILDKTLWQGQYIGMKREDRKVQPLLTKTFQCSDTKSPTFLHISTLGYHELYLNGQRISDDVLAPAITEFAKRYKSMTYCLDGMLREGRNDLTIWLGGGWYDNPGLEGVIAGGPYVLAQVDQQQGNSWQTLVKTDGSWHARSNGYYDDGLAAAGQFGGEVIKAQEFLPDFTATSLDAASWQGVTTIDMPSQQITPMMCEPNKITLEVPAQQVSRFGDRWWMVDMGRSIVGWTRIRLGHLRKGQRITISYCDMLGLNGDFDQGVFTDYYIASGEGEEVFQNKFNYHAYRYIKIEGLDHQPACSDIAGMLIHTDYGNGSAFVSSDASFNAIHDMVHYTFRCLTLGGYMVDCPHFERQGYGGDGNASILAAQLQYNMYPLYRNWLQAYGDAQGEDGEVPHVAPDFWQCGGGPFWCAFIANAPWQTYQQYGDLRLLERMYPNMQRYLSYAEKYMPNGMLLIETRWPSTRKKNWFLGDWALPNEEHQTHFESIDLTNCCSMSWVYGIMANVAEHLGKADDARLYHEKQEKLNRRIHDTYYNKRTARYAYGLQLDEAFPLFVGATPDGLQAKVNKALTDMVYDEYDSHLYTGLVGIPIVTQWCTRAGNVQLMADMLRQHSFPGYMYMIDNGATTTWEHWTARRSRIHNCFNGIGSWFYQALAGIGSDPSKPAYRHFTIQPQLPDDLSFVRALKPTPYGDITVDWKRSLGVFDLRVTIPAGTTATIRCPKQIKAVSAEIAAYGLNRSGLVFNESERDRKPDPEPTRFSPDEPIELGSGHHRIIYRLSKR